MATLKFITLQEIKAQCRVDHDEEDALLESIGIASEEIVLKYINRTYYDIVDDFGEFPEPLRRAVLLMVADQYAHREISTGAAQNSVPYNFEFFLKPYIKLTSRYDSDREPNGEG